MSGTFDPALREQIISHVARRVESVTVDLEPFPHILVQGFLPADVYDRLLTSFPPLPLYEPVGYEKHQQHGESNRRRFQLTNPWLDRLSSEERRFWYSLRSALGSEEVKTAVFKTLAPGLALRFDVSKEQAGSLPGYALPELFQETQGYRIKPHPDTRKKVVTMQIALAADASQESLGTEFYRRTANPRAWLREPRGFEIARRMPFLPNTAYAFSVLNTLRLKSWHGRTEINGAFAPRNSILNIWYEKPEHANADLVAERVAMTARRGGKAA